MRKNYRYIIKVLPVLFLVFLLTPTLNGYFQLMPEYSSTENRGKASKPIFNIDSITQFPEQYDSYFQDNFSFRNFYLFTNNFFTYFVLNKSTVEDKVVIGKDGWLFRNNSALPFIAKTNSYSNTELRNLKYEIEQRNEYYKSIGIDYYIFIAPNKASVYYEQVGDRYNVPKGTNYRSRTDRFMEFVKNDNSINNVFYLKDLLRRKKDKHQVYYKKDHHWNRKGALFATDLINEELRKRYPIIHNTAQLQSYNVYTNSKHKGNLANTLGLQEVLLDDIVYLEAKDGIKIYNNGTKRGYKPPKYFGYPSSYEKCTVVANDSLPKAVIIRDSFTNNLIPFLSNSFSDALYIWDFWNYGWNKDIIQKEDPDIVINIIVEEHLYNLVKHSDLEY